MAYTVTKLITNAYYTSGIRSSNFNTVSGPDLAIGLDLLNDILAIKTADNTLIPYFSSYTVTATPNVETYFIPNLIYPETMTFNLQTVVRFGMMQQGRKTYFGSPRVNNIASLPFQWHLERAKGGANLYVYFLPNSNYPITLWGKFSLASVTINQDLEATMDRFYIVYLRYALANAICDFKSQSFAHKDQLQDYEDQITDLSPPDLTVTKLSTLQGNVGMNWAYINFPGWEAPR